ncbi:MAG: ribonuclease J [Patescibacteria group bacterium]
MPQLKVIPLGGMGGVTQNMFVYEYEDEMLIVDCGIGFPDTYMPGVDILIPDARYVFEQVERGKRIIGMILTHGHDDHIAAAPYLLGKLPDFPIYASPLTALFAERRLEDGGVSKTVQKVHDTNPVHLSSYFSARFIPVTHSIPDTRHVLITTPIGNIYHGSDFKIDPSPVDGKLTDLSTIEQVAADGVHCMMIDCLRVENPGHSRSESAVGPTIMETMAKTQGKYIVTLMSSHIHRIQQVIAAAERYKRKVVFVGRSVEQNVTDALELKKLSIPHGMQVDKKKIDTVPDDKLCVIVAGSQGQEGSSMMRAIFGEHPVLQITERDTVVFSATAIPGNELPYFGAIDELSRNGVHVIYPDVMDNLHSSGHAGRVEQQELVQLIKPKFVMPIGGADRHRFKFFEYIAEPLGMDREHVLLPESGDAIGFDGKQVSRVDTIVLQPQAVDGLGIGDVGKVVLSDRRTLSQSGIVTVVIPRSKNKLLLDKIEVVSRGFIFMKEAEEVIEYIKQTVAEIAGESKKTPKDEEIKRTIERRLGRRLYKIIRREPMIVPVILDID